MILTTKIIALFIKFMFFSAGLVLVALNNSMSAAAVEQMTSEPTKKDQLLFSVLFERIEKGGFSNDTDFVGHDNSLLGRKTIRWLEMTKGLGNHSLAEMINFIEQNPDWPQLSAIRRQVENLMIDKTPAAQELINWFSNYPPQTSAGKRILGEAYLEIGETDTAKRILNETWVGGIFSHREQKSFLKRHQRILAEENHWRRLDQLLWKGKTHQAKRIMHLVSKARRRQADARIKLRRQSPGVDLSIRRLSPPDISEPGFVFERILWRRKKGRTEAALDLLNRAPQTTTRPDLWAQERLILARRLISQGKFKSAWEVSAAHNVDPQRFRYIFSKIQWLAGWTALRFLKDPQISFRYFEKLYSNVRYPVSRARAAYWLARAAKKIGNDKLERSWKKEAAKHWSTFYGQLALVETVQREKIPIPGTLKNPYKEYKNTLRRDELSNVAIFLEKIGQRKLSLIFFQKFFYNGSWPEIASRAAKLAKILDRPDMAVWLSRECLKKGIILLEEGYPLIKISTDLVEKNLIRSVIRQESSFDPQARSQRGALGYMQLMPSTARQVSKQIGIPFVAGGLVNDGDYNVMLGAEYLAQLLRRFNGSYILAIAAFNAGPSKVQSWLDTIGDPRSPSIDPLDWIELIPYAETRTYVQRVLANLQIFRYLETRGALAMELKNDLHR
jgi:soluble lytic murein transglycosylase